VWDDSAPPDGRDSDELGAAIRELRVDIKQRMDTYFDDFDADPLVPIDEFSGTVVDRELMIDHYGFIEVSGLQLQSNDGFLNLTTTISSETTRKGVIIPIGYEITEFAAYLRTSTADTTTFSLRCVDAATGAVTNVSGDLAQVGDDTIKLVISAPLSHIVAAGQVFYIPMTLDDDNVTRLYGFRLKISKTGNAVGY
jgi:hypothetical protein